MIGKKSAASNEQSKKSPERKLDPKSQAKDNQKPITPIKTPVSKTTHEPNNPNVPAVTKEIHDKDPNPQKPSGHDKNHPNHKGHAELSYSEELENKIKSRKRILESLEEQTKPFTSDMILELSSRDSIIEEQNKELILLKSKLKEYKKSKDKEKDNKLQAEKQKVVDLENEKSQLETKLFITIDKHRNEIQKMEEEKSRAEALQETMMEEIELLRAQQEAKDEELQSVIADIKKLSEIVQQFKKLNEDLNEKIEKQNVDYEEMNVKYYESEVKSSNVNDIESSLQDYIRIYQQSESRANKFSEELRALQIMYDDVQGFYSFSEDQLEKALEHIPSDNGARKILIHLKTELSKKKKIEIPESQESEKDIKNSELTEKLNKYSLEIKKLENSYKPLNEQLKGTQDLLKKLKSEHVSSVESLTKTIKALQDYNDTVKADLNNLRSENAKKDSRISAMTHKLNGIEEKNTKTEEKIKKFKDTLAATEKELNEFKAKNVQQKAMINDRNGHISNLEKQNAKYASTIQVLHEEFWKKDTQVIKVKKTLSLLQKSINDAASERGNSPTKKAEKIEKLNKELHEKDQKIQILKEMIRSNQIQLKDKKGSGLSPEMSMQEISTEKLTKSSGDVMSSLAAKTINKFFAICGFPKNSSESSSDMQRMLKKLKQDLKSYTVFNVKDLQNSVPKLQNSFLDSKPNISLDELITAISRIVKA